MYSYWLKPDQDFDPCTGNGTPKWPGGNFNSRYNTHIKIILLDGYRKSLVSMCAQALYLLRLASSWGRFGKCVYVCVSALSQLSVMMHCMLETFLCHVFLLAQARSRLRPVYRKWHTKVARWQFLSNHNTHMPDQFACHTEQSTPSARWHLQYHIKIYIIGLNHHW